MKVDIAGLLEGINNSVFVKEQVELIAKERIEIYAQERTLITDNFRLTEGFGFNGFSKLKTTIDKGHAAQFKLLVERVKSGGAPLVPFEDAVNTTLASFAAIESLLTRQWVNV